MTDFKEYLTIPTSKSELDLDSQILKCVEDSVQRLILTKLISSLQKKLISKCSEQSASLKYKLFFLRGKNQHFFEIPKEHQSHKKFFKSHT
eukprot:UN03030